MRKYAAAGLHDSSFLIHNSAVKLLMISGDRSILAGKRGAFWHTLEEFHTHWERVDVICPRSGQWPVVSGQTSEFENVWFHPSPWPLAWQKRWITEKGAQLIADHHHDVMTVHEYPPFFNGLGARKLHRVSGIPYVLEVHHVVGAPTAASLAERAGRLMSRLYLPWAARRACGVRVVSRSVMDLLVAWGVPGEKLRLVPSFYLDAGALKPDAAVAKAYDVVTAARLVANKGLLELIDAVGALPGVRLLLIGDGPLKTRLQRRVQTRGMADRVAFAGWLPDQRQLVHAMQSGRIFVMNSRSEGGPRSALEAMALGLPVIATRVGAMPEVIRDRENGVFTDGSVRDLSRQISRLLTDTAVQERLGQAARKILERFERKTLIRQYAEFLKGFAR